MIQLDGVSKTFEDGGRRVEAVKGVCLTIASGDIYGIIGSSGAGKSTLVRCMNLLERPSAGTVRFEGVDLTSLDTKTLRATRQQIGMIFQQFNLFASRTVAENVAYALRGSKLSKAARRARVQELLTLVELEDKADVYPSALSGGQKQRVAIARALARAPKVLLCDEATSALDPQTTASILALLKRLNETLGLTLVVITHEMDVVKAICNRVAVMDGGRVVESGDVFSVFAHPQMAVTQRLLDATLVLAQARSLLNADAAAVALAPGECLVQLKYLVRSASVPLVSTISRRYNIDCNIIFGNIELLNGEPLGGLIAILSGDDTAIEEALVYLREQNVGVEVLRDARVVDTLVS